jgi:hypothetical protein
MGRRASSRLGMRASCFLSARGFDLADGVLHGVEH